MCLACFVLFVSACVSFVYLVICECLCVNVCTPECVCVSVYVCVCVCVCVCVHLPQLYCCVNQTVLFRLVEILQSVRFLNFDWSYVEHYSLQQFLQSCCISKLKLICTGEPSFHSQVTDKKL